MSALLTHAKALHALGSAFQRASLTDPEGKHSGLCMVLSVVCSAAADDLGEQARAEASPPETCAGCGGASPAPGKRCAVCQRLKAS